MTASVRKVHKDDGNGWLLCGRNTQYTFTGAGYRGSKRWSHVTCSNCLRLKRK
jgi:hypothetical protein